MSAPAERLLSRLDAVRETSAGRWVAKCAAHDDRSPSLSIRQLDDGRVLIYCFAGCQAADVVAAAGLNMGDLFPNGAKHHRIEPGRSRISAADRLALIDGAALVVAMVGAAMLKNRKIDPPDFDRLAEAVTQIGAAQDCVA